MQQNQPITIRQHTPSALPVVGPPAQKLPDRFSTTPPMPTLAEPTHTRTLTSAHLSKKLPRNAIVSQATYNGPTNLPVYCTDCATPIQVVFVDRPVVCCPFCASTNLVSSEAKHTIDHAASLHLTPALYTILRQEFRSQKAYTVFSEYVACIVHGAQPTTDRALQDAQRERMKHTI